MLGSSICRNSVMACFRMHMCNSQYARGYSQHQQALFWCTDDIFCLHPNVMPWLDFLLQNENGPDHGIAIDQAGLDDKLEPSSSTASATETSNALHIAFEKFLDSKLCGTPAVEDKVKSDQVNAIIGPFRRVYICTPLHHRKRSMALYTFISNNVLLDIYANLYWPNALRCLAVLNLPDKDSEGLHGLHSSFLLVPLRLLGNWKPQ